MLKTNTPKSFEKMNILENEYSLEMNTFHQKIEIRRTPANNFVEGIYFFLRQPSGGSSSGAAKPPVIRRKRRSRDINSIMPAEITCTHWSDWNDSDMIKYKSARGEEFLVQDENLLRDISQFMYDNGLRGDIPYIHVKGKLGWECYPNPCKNYILAFLILHLNYFDIYTTTGELVKEARKVKIKKIF